MLTNVSLDYSFPIRKIDFYTADDDGDDIDVDDDLISVIRS